MSEEATASFETAIRQATRSVPIVRPSERAGDVRAALVGSRFQCASHVVLCEDDRFAGIVRIEELLAAPDESPIESIADTESPTVAPGMDREIAAWRAARNGESALAVVDGENRFQGIIPPSRLLEVLLSEHEEDLSRLGGFLRSATEARTSSEEPVGRRFRHRIPWLVLGLAGALVAADMVGWFESQLRQNISLAFFIPGIVYLADAVGTQTETIVVRGLSIGIPVRTMAARESIAGLIIGLALAVIAGPVVWLRWGDAHVAAAVGLALAAACSVAAFVAMALPWVFSRFGRDPAFGSGPLATVIQDLLSILIYFGIVLAVVRT